MIFLSLMMRRTRHCGNQSDNPKNKWDAGVNVQHSLKTRLIYNGHLQAPLTIGFINKPF